MAETFFQLPTAPRVTHPETKAPTLLTPVESARDMAAFQRVPEHVHWGDPYRVAPIKAEERAGFDPGASPFFARGEARLWTAWHGHGQPVGRLAAFVERAGAAAGGRAGFFGFIDFMNDARIPEALLVEGTRWLRERGAGEILGPVAFSTGHEPRGVLVDGFHDDPPFLAAYNPPSYAGFLERAGLEKAWDEHGFALDTTAPPPAKLAGRAAEVAARDGLAVRAIDLGARFAAEWDALHGLLVEARAATPRHPAAPLEEWRALGRRVLPILRAFPDGAVALEEKGAVAGFAVAMLDWNRVLKHLGGSLYPLGWLKATLMKRTVERLRLLAFAVRGEGRARSLPLVRAVWAAAHARRFRSIEVPGVPEDAERATRLLAGLGAKRTRAWRVFRVPASFPGATTPARAPQ